MKNKVMNWALSTFYVGALFICGHAVIDTLKLNLHANVFVYIISALAFMFCVWQHKKATFRVSKYSFDLGYDKGYDDAEEDAIIDAEVDDEDDEDTNTTTTTTT